MKLRTLPLAILLLLLLTLIGYAQTPPDSPNGQSNDFGIEPEQFYPGILVLELMEAAEAEIDAAVREAYAEGYKAAALRFMPELAAKDEEIASLKIDRRKNRLNIIITGGLSFLGGAAISVIMAGR